MRPASALRCASLALIVLTLASCASNPKPAIPSVSRVTPPTVRPTVGSSSPSVTADWPTYHGDLARTGHAAKFPTPKALRIAADVKLDGQVYASPIVAQGITVVATEQDSVYGLDYNGRQLWRTSLGTPARSADLPCGNIDPSGVTGTPVYRDGTVYVAPEYGNPVRHELVALDPSTVRPRWRVNIDLPGADPRAMQERGALTITGDRVWVPFGGRFGDCGDYKGRLIGVPLDGQGAPIAYTVPTPREGGIWAPPGAVVDPAGTLYVAVGNGEHGQGDSYDYSDSVLRIGTDVKLIDSFSPTTWGSDNEDDLDLGTQSPVLVGTKWVFIVGKSGSGYVLRVGHLGGVGGQVWQGEVCRSFGGAATDGGLVYLPCTDGVRAVRIDDSGVAHVMWHAAGSIAGSPVVGGGRVWALDQQAGVLHALNPTSGRSTIQIAVGQTSRFATPALYGKHVLVPTLAGLAIVAV